MREDEICDRQHKVREDKMCDMKHKVREEEMCDMYHKVSSNVNRLHKKGESCTCSCREA